MSKHLTGNLKTVVNFKINSEKFFTAEDICVVWTLVKYIRSEWPPSIRLRVKLCSSSSKINAICKTTFEHATFNVQAKSQLSIIACVQRDWQSAPPDCCIKKVQRFEMDHLLLPSSYCNYTFILFSMPFMLLPRWKRRRIKMNGTHDKNNSFFIYFLKQWAWA